VINGKSLSTGAMISLTTWELPEKEISARLSQWLFFNHGRHILTLAGWLVALKALSLSPKHWDDL
jgi:hypothetical protein